MSDRLGKFNGVVQEIMQSCTADNVTNNNSNNISQIWRRVFIYFRQIENRFDYKAIGESQ